MNVKYLIVFHVLVSLSGNDIPVIAEDVGHGIFDEWVEMFHHEISLALVATEKANISNSCKTGLHSYLRDLQSHQPWAVQMFDSMDPLPAGLMQGNVVYWPGNFDECLSVQHFEWKPQYCLTQVLINDQSNEIARIFQFNTSVEIGICLPSTCTNQEVINFLNSLITPNATVTATSCQSTSSQYLDSAAIAIIVVLSIFGLLFVIGTLSEFIMRFITNRIGADSGEKEENAYLLSLMSFSGISNLKVLFSTDQKGGIDCLHGLKFLSMAWVILVHVYTSPLTLSWNNRPDVYAMKNNFFAEIILNATFAVDSFFCMSGLLVSYVFFKKIMKTKRFSLIEYYLHRYIRLTPVYAIVIGIAAGLFPYIGSGPRWGEMIEASHNCKNQWWLNLLYVSNMFNEMHTCQPHGWFLAADMQLHFFAPVIMYPLYLNKRVGLGIAATVGMCCIIAVGLVTYFDDLPATGITFAVESSSRLQYLIEIYFMAFAKVGQYIIGILIGYILSIQPEAPKFFNKKVAVFGWLAGSICNMSLLFGLFKFVFDGTIPSIVERCFYSALSRTGWGLGIAWIILACKWSYGGPVNSILSWKIFIPLGKLTYCAYILHFNLTSIFYTSRRSTLNYDLWMAMSIYLGILCLSYVLAIPFTLLFELPFLKLEKLITTRGMNKSVVSVSNSQKIGSANDMIGVTNPAFEGQN